MSYPPSPQRFIQPRSAELAGLSGPSLPVGLRGYPYSTGMAAQVPDANGQGVVLQLRNPANSGIDFNVSRVWVLSEIATRIANVTSRETETDLTITTGIVQRVVKGASLAKAIITLQRNIGAFASTVIESVVAEALVLIPLIRPENAVWVKPGGAIAVEFRDLANNLTTDRFWARIHWTEEPTIL